MDSVDEIVGLPPKALRDPSSRKASVKELERCYDRINITSRTSIRPDVLEILDGLIYEFGFYVADPVARAQDPSYYGDERLVKEIESALRSLSKAGIVVPQYD